MYRLLFIFVAEDRDLLFAPETDLKIRERYTRYYSTSRIRRLAGRKRGTRHPDLYQGFRIVMQKLGSDEGCPELGLPALGSFLFSDAAISSIEGCEIANSDLLAAIRALAYTLENGALRPVDYRNLGSEELGSVYESLLELHPELNLGAGVFKLRTAAGNERKTTGSYYTPTGLIQILLDSALDPVLDEAVKKPNPEEALLALKVCDPACGSGHFLIAAAHRIAKRVASVRTGDIEPSPEATRTALRQVISKCIYGVDINPMSVELCKVALWMEAIDPGKPLSFLDHHIQCGNSLIGATPRLLREGIPDAAFQPVEGDDKAVCSEYRKRNKQERESGQQSLFGHDLQPWEQLGNLATAMMSLDADDDGSVAAEHRKQEKYEKLVSSTDYEYGRLLADTWCAAFVLKKTRELDYPITEEVLRRIERTPHWRPDWMKKEVQRLAGQYQFFHWQLAFPDVFRVPASDGAPENEQTGWSGGFDCVLGNPPWERVKLQEEEFFAEREPEIAKAPNKAARARLIKSLPTTDPVLAQEFEEAKRAAENSSKFIRDSGRYPLTGVGDVNTYAMFAELFRAVLSSRGCAGIICPTGIATDNTTKAFFDDLTARRSLVSVIGFENEAFIFPNVHHSFKFCALTVAGSRADVREADFAFLCRHFADVHDTIRHFRLSASDIALLNPNTRTCPVFRTQPDAELTKAIYRRVPVLLNEATGDNPWGVRFQAMFHMANDSGLFQSGPGDGLLPLYEAKMMHQFDHRYATYEGATQANLNAGILPQTTPRQKTDPSFAVRPRYWVSEDEALRRSSNLPPTILDALLEDGDPWESLLHPNDKLIQGVICWFGGHFYNTGHDERARELFALQQHLYVDPELKMTRQDAMEMERQCPLTEEELRLFQGLPVAPGDLTTVVRCLLWGRAPRWLICFRDVTSTVVLRTVIFGVLPALAVGHKAPIMFPAEATADLSSCLFADLNSFVLDYVARLKMSGGLSYFFLKQFPVLPLSAYASADVVHIAPRVLELVYTAWNVKAYADNLWSDANPALREAMRRQWDENGKVTGGHSWDHPDPIDWDGIDDGGPIDGHYPPGEDEDWLIPFPPFKWDEDRRALLRAELDAYYAKLYGLNRKQLRYILDPHGLSKEELEDILDPWEDPTCSGPHLLPAETALDFPGETFRVLKNKEEKLFGEYRTRRLVLEAWDRLHREGLMPEPYDQGKERSVDGA